MVSWILISDSGNGLVSNQHRAIIRINADTSSKTPQVTSIDQVDSIQLIKEIEIDWKIIECSGKYFVKGSKYFGLDLTGLITSYYMI